MGPGRIAHPPIGPGMRVLAEARVRLHGSSSGAKLRVGPGPLPGGSRVRTRRRRYVARDNAYHGSWLICFGGRAKPSLPPGGPELGAEEQQLGAGEHVVVATSRTG
jgi:hypothetical protein